jgi:hypothetical protein
MRNNVRQSEGMSMLRIAVCATLVLVAFAAAGCGRLQSPPSASPQRSSPSSVTTTSTSASATGVQAQTPRAATSFAVTSPVRVWMTPRVVLRGNALTVAVRTNLIDGSGVHWEVGRARSVDEWSDYRSGVATVHAGQFSIATDVRAIPGRKLYVFLDFITVKQPPEAMDLYGLIGQNLRGDHIEKSGDYSHLSYWVGVKR